VVTDRALAARRVDSRQSHFLREHGRQTVSDTEAITSATSVLMVLAGTKTFVPSPSSCRSIVVPGATFDVLSSSTPLFEMSTILLASPQGNRTVHNEGTSLPRRRRARRRSRRGSY
jgi:hypothetical protein